MRIIHLKWNLKINISLLFLIFLSIKAFGQLAVVNKPSLNEENAFLKYQELKQLINEDAATGIALFKNHQKTFFSYPEIYAKAFIEAAEGHSQLAQFGMAHILVDSAQAITKDSMVYYEALYHKGRFFYKEKAFLTAFKTFQRCKSYFKEKDPIFSKKTNQQLVPTLIRLGELYEELNQDSFYLFLLKAEAIIAQPDYLNNINKVNVLYTLGAHYARTYDTLKAFQYFDKASQIKVDFASLVQQNITYEKGLIYGKLGLWDAAMEQHKISLTIATKSKHNYSIYANTMSIGLLFYDIADYKKAKAYYQQGYDFAKKIKNDYLFTDALTKLGNIHVKTKNYKKAIAFYERSMMVNDTLQNKYRMVTNNLGIACAKEGLQLHTEAYHYNQKAYSMAKALGFKEELVNSTVLFANLALELKNYPVTIQKSKEVLALQTHISQLVLTDTYNNLSKTYEALGNYSEALKYHQLLKIETDSFFNAEKIKAFAEKEAHFQNEKITIENQHLKAAQLQQNTIIHQRTWLAVVIGVSLLLAGILIWSLAQKNKQKQLINQLLKKEVQTKTTTIKEKEIQLDNLNENTKSLEKLVEEKDYYLVTKVAALNKYNKQIEALGEDLTQLMQEKTPNNKSLYQLKRKLRTIQHSENNYLQEFNLSLKNHDPIFFRKLVQKYPNLTQNELNHCAFIRLNMTMKEVADLMNITENSVKKARYRLKKKIGLVIGIDLKKHLLSM